MCVLFVPNYSNYPKWFAFVFVCVSFVKFCLITDYSVGKLFTLPCNFRYWKRILVFFDIHLSPCSKLWTCVKLFTWCYLQDEGNGLYTGDGSVDLKGKPVLKQNTGNWRACPFILGDLLILCSLWISNMYWILIIFCICYRYWMLWTLGLLRDCH